MGLSAGFILGGRPRDGNERESCVEERQQLQHMLEMNGYFGVLAVYATFERCLHETFQDMKRLKLIKERRLYLTLDKYKDCFQGIEIKLTATALQSE